MIVAEAQGVQPMANSKAQVRAFLAKDKVAVAIAAQCCTPPSDAPVPGTLDGAGALRGWGKWLRAGMVKKRGSMATPQVWHSVMALLPMCIQWPPTDRSETCVTWTS